MRVVFVAALAAALFVLPSAAGAQDAAQLPATPAPQEPAPSPQQPPASAPQQAAPSTQKPGATTTQPGTAGAPQTPGAPQAPGTTVTPGTTAPAPVAARAFTANSGLLFNTVKADRTADFEQVIGYLQQALQKSTDPMVQAQARGWRVFKAMEAGPNNTVLYVFVLDPAVPGADYGLGHILGQAYTDPAQLQEIWKLYTGSVTGGGTLLNLTPVGAAAAPDAGAPAPLALPDTQPKMLPPDADPNRP